MKKRDIQNRYKSLFITVGISIVITVVAIMTIHSTYTYFYEKNEIIQNIKKSVDATLASLQKNIKPFMEAYAINEYENLVANEMEDSKSHAIVVQDYNMGKILGEDVYITGKIRDKNNNIIDYTQDAPLLQDMFQGCFYKKSAPIVADSKTIGEITVCMSDKQVQDRKAYIIKNTILNALFISISQLIAILFILHKSVFRPITKMVTSLQKQDPNGIPTEKVPTGSSKEIYILSETINKMLETIKESQRTLTDINKTLETRINRAVEEIREKDTILHENVKQRAMDDMLVNIAHQWRQPLNAASVAIQSIDDYLGECKDREEIEHLITVAVKELIMLSDTITRFTKFYEVEASQLVNIEDGLKIFTSISENVLESQNIIITTSFDDEFKLISATNEWVELFSVFLKNIEEIKKERELKEATLSIEGRTEENQYILTITDDAGGISEDLLPTRLFEPYITTYFRSKEKGLGLYTARHIVKYVFRGSITAQNYKNGARFTIIIPRN